MATLTAVTALVSAAGVAQVEYYRLREAADPWAIPEKVFTAQKTALQATSRQLASLLELVTRHRTRRAASTVNTRQRAVQAAVVRDLEVRIPPMMGHSGEAARMEVELENRSPIDLEVRFNVALPGGAWTVLEPQARGSKGLMFVGPVDVPARSTRHVPLVVYVPTTARLDDYTIPVEVVPEGRDIVPEQWGETR